MHLVAVPKHLDCSAADYLGVINDQDLWLFSGFIIHAGLFPSAGSSRQYVEKTKITAEIDSKAISAHKKDSSISASCNTGLRFDWKFLPNHGHSAISKCVG
jgi:hypothetical protein